MALRRILVSDFRCLQSVDAEFDPRLTLVSGPNGSGKTSLLESIYVLGRGRSFRTRRLEHLIRDGSQQFVIFGSAELMDRTVGLGVEGSGQGMRARLGGDRVGSLTDLAAVLPVQIIDPEVHRLIEEGPGRRRRFLDWGVFHVEHDFVEHWQRYQKALRQRNAALLARQTRSVVTAWDSELIRLGELIHAARTRYILQLADDARDIAKRLLQMEVSLSYRSGWGREGSLAEALERCWGVDSERGSTQVGPQRAEVVIRLNGMPVRDRISRGQQKLLAATLLMSQLRLLPRDSGIQPILLLDDPAAELDSERLLGLIREVSDPSLQLVITSLGQNLAAFGTPGRCYELHAGVLVAR